MGRVSLLANDIRDSGTIVTDPTSLKDKIRKTIIQSSSDLKSVIKTNHQLNQIPNSRLNPLLYNYRDIPNIISKKNRKIRDSLILQKDSNDNKMKMLTEFFISERNTEILKKKSVYLFYNSIFAISVCFLFKIGLLDSFRDGFLNNLGNMNFLHISDDPYLKLKDFSELNSTFPDFNQIMLQESSRDKEIDLEFLNQANSNLDSLDEDMNKYKNLVLNKYIILDCINEESKEIMRDL